MIPSIVQLTVAALIFCMALPVSAQQFLLYSPQPLNSAEKTPEQDGGILVREIEVQKGDTLYGISRKFSGRGMYYPQILLFNSIKNPNLIYPGNTLKVPVTKTDSTAPEQGDTKPGTVPRKPKLSTDKKISSKLKSRTTKVQSTVINAATEISLSDIKSGNKSDNISTSRRRTSTVPEKASSVTDSAVSPPLLQSTTSSNSADTSASDGERDQKLFETAVKAYRKDDCRTALELFDRYLTNNSGSPLAADATLYKAECYMKLSSQ